MGEREEGEGRGSRKQKGAILWAGYGEGEGMEEGEVGEDEEEGSREEGEGREGRKEGVGVKVRRQFGQAKQTVAQAPFLITSLPLSTTLLSSFSYSFGTPTNPPFTPSSSLTPLLIVPRSRKVCGREERGGVVEGGERGERSSLEKRGRR